MATPERPPRRRLFERLEARVYLAGDPVAEWRFDSASGATLVDSVGVSNGAITGSSVYNQTATALVSAMPRTVAVTSRRRRINWPPTTVGTRL